MIMIDDDGDNVSVCQFAYWSGQTCSFTSPDGCNM